MAEFAIRRIHRRLETLETRLSNARVGPDALCWSMQSKEDALAALEAEIALQNTRLRALLAE